MAPPPLTACALCATLGKTCCQSRDILGTEGDKSCIGRFVGEQDVWEHARPNDSDYLDQGDDPSWLAWAFRPGGRRPILKRQFSGDCRFLSTTGCIHPLEVRPLVCQLYPYTYTECGLGGMADDCPRQVIPPGRAILQVPDVRQADAIHRHRMLYAELCTKEPCDADRDDVRPAS